MKQRLLVMNGQRILQNEQNGSWTNQKVDKAGALKPGIYNLYLAEQADKTKRYDGVIVHVDSSHIYQQIEKKFVLHSRMISIMYLLSGMLKASVTTIKARQWFRPRPLRSVGVAHGKF